MAHLIVLTRPDRATEDKRRSTFFSKYMQLISDLKNGVKSLVWRPKAQAGDFVFDDIVIMKHIASSRAADRYIPLCFLFNTEKTTKAQRMMLIEKFASIEQHVYYMNEEAGTVLAIIPVLPHLGNPKEFLTGFYEQVVEKNVQLFLQETAK